MACSREIYIKPIDPRYQNVAAANRRSCYGSLRTIGARKFHQHTVGMNIAQIGAGKRELHALLGGDAERIRDAVIIRTHSENARNKSNVSAVPFVGLRERSM